MRSFAVFAFAVAVLGTPALGQAQTRVSVYRGVGEYDLSGVDSAPVTAVRASHDFSRFFSLEAGMTYVELRIDLPLRLGIVADGRVRNSEACPP